MLNRVKFTSLLFVIVLTNGCSLTNDSTCPLPLDGICAPIHVVDFNWKTTDTKVKSARLSAPSHLTTRGEE